MTVSNTLSSVIPTLFSQGLMSLRSNCVMPRLVNTDFGTEVRQKGDTIQVPIPSALAVTAVVPGAYAPDSQNVAPTTASIPLSHWDEAPFTLSEKEIAQIVEGIVPIQVSSAVEALATSINSSILGLYKGIYGFTGTAGTTPFASTINSATDARKILGVNRAPTDNRRIVLGPDAEANALSLPAFYGALSSGDPQVITEGTIGRKFGFDWAMDQQVPTHTAGTITTGLKAKATTAQAIGLKAVVCTTAASTGACALVVGDVIDFGVAGQTYTVTAVATQASAASDVTVNIYPGLLTALAGGETVTVRSNHVVNLAFHRDAFAFASRPLGNTEDLTANPDETFQVSDPVSGLSMRLTYRKEFHRTRFSFDVLYGVGLIRPELAVRIAG